MTAPIYGLDAVFLLAHRTECFFPEVIRDHLSSAPKNVVVE